MRPKKPEDEVKGRVLRTRATISLFNEIKSRALLNGVSLSAEITHRLQDSLTSGAPTKA